MEALTSVPQGGSPKHAYPLHAHNNYTTKAGQLGVVDFINTVPNGDYEIGVDNYTMTKILNTHNFARMKENFYFIHVPISQLDRSFHQMNVQRTESVSALEFSNLQAVTFPLGTVVQEAIRMAGVQYSVENARYYDIHGFNIGAGAIRLLDMLGYGCFVDICEAYVTGAIPYSVVEQICATITEQPSVYNLLAYQKAWYCFFRNDIYHEVSPKCFNVDDVTLGAENTTYDVLTSRDVTTTTFIIQCCQLRYVQHKKDWLTAAMPGTQYGVVSAVPLKSDLVVGLTGSVGSDWNKWTQSTGESTGGDSVVISGGSSPWSLGTATTSLIEHTHNVGSVEATLPANSSLFDVLQLVEAQAMQKWRQKSMMAGNKTRNQYMAHHGVVPKDLFDYTPDFIGSVDNTINVSSIEALADTAVSEGSSNLGQLAGRGRGRSDTRTFKLHSDTYGVLLILRSIVPENTYSSYGMDLNNTEIFYSDFFQDEFQNLGLRVVPKYAMDVLMSSSVPGSNVSGDTPDEGLNYFPDAVGVRGFAPAYFYKKQRLSKAHGFFNPSRLRIEKYTGTDDPSLDGVYFPDTENEFGYNDMQSFVSVMSDYNSYIRVVLIRDSKDDPYRISELEFVPQDNDVSQLYVSPAMVNSLFAFDANDSQLTDEFIHWTYTICNSYTPMSPLGLPQF